jgi:carbonic anhydrase
VLRQPVQVSPEQIELFAKLYPMNARPVQQAAGRRILQSQ